MNLSEMYPAMSKAHRKLVVNSMLAAFDYILEVGEDEVCKFLVDEDADVSMFEHAAKRIEEYKNRMSALSE